MKRSLMLFAALVLAIAGSLMGRQLLAVDAAQSKYPIELKLTDIAGQPLDLAAYHGKVVVVDVWATWCHYCVAEIPDVIKFQQEMTKANKPVQVIGLAVEDEADSVKAFVKEHHVDYPVALTTKKELKPQFGSIPGIPEAFILNDKGVIVDTIVGMTDKATLTRTVNRYLPK